MELRPYQNEANDRIQEEWPNTTIFRLDEKISQLGNLAPIHQKEEANDAVVMFTDPNAVSYRVIFFVEFTQTLRHIVFKLNAVAIFRAVQRAVQINDVTDITRAEFGAD